MYTEPYRTIQFLFIIFFQTAGYFSKMFVDSATFYKKIQRPGFGGSCGARCTALLTAVLHVYRTQSEPRPAHRKYTNLLMQLLVSYSYFLLSVIRDSCRACLPYHTCSTKGREVWYSRNYSEVLQLYSRFNTLKYTRTPVYIK